VILSRVKRKSHEKIIKTHNDYSHICDNLTSSASFVCRALALTIVLFKVRYREIKYIKLVAIGQKASISNYATGFRKIRYYITVT